MTVPGVQLFLITSSVDFWVITPKRFGSFKNTEIPVYDSTLDVGVLPKHHCYF